MVRITFENVFFSQVSLSCFVAVSLKSFLVDRMLFHDTGHGPFDGSLELETFDGARCLSPQARHTPGSGTRCPWGRHLVPPVQQHPVNADQQNRPIGRETGERGPSSTFLWSTSLRIGALRHRPRCSAICPHSSCAPWHSTVTVSIERDEERQHVVADALAEAFGVARGPAPVAGRVQRLAPPIVRRDRGTYGLTEEPLRGPPRRILVRPPRRARPWPLDRMHT